MKVEFELVEDETFSQVIHFIPCFIALESPPRENLNMTSKSDYQIIGHLGKGAYGDVALGQHRTTDENGGEGAIFLSSSSSSSVFFCLLAIT